MILGLTFTTKKGQSGIYQCEVKVIWYVEISLCGNTTDETSCLFPMLFRTVREVNKYPEHPKTGLSRCKDAQQDGLVYGGKYVGQLVGTGDMSNGLCEVQVTVVRCSKVP